jgi:hypothetical protein
MACENSTEMQSEEEKKMEAFRCEHLYEQFHLSQDLFAIWTEIEAIQDRVRTRQFSGFSGFSDILASLISKAEKVLQQIKTACAQIEAYQQKFAQQFSSPDPQAIDFLNHLEQSRSGLDEVTNKLKVVLQGLKSLGQ